jgi:tripartite-type tricarboxylate transporter receptor subunit TctC
MPPFARLTLTALVIALVGTARPQNFPTRTITIVVPYWQGIFAPAATPRRVVDRLNAALQAALADPKILKTFAETGMTAFPPAEQTPEAANALLGNEIARWSAVIRANGIEVLQ